MEKLEIICVNFNTPDLLLRLLNSVRNCTDLPIRILDGSDREPYITETRNLCGFYNNLILEQVGYNIHHGPGMHRLVSTSKAESVLIMDSDTELLPGFLQTLEFTHPYSGFGCWVNKNGCNTFGKCGVYEEVNYLYLHPEILLVDVEYYKNSPYKFIKHGAPAIQIMTNIPDVDKLPMLEENRKLYTRIGRGTCGRWGYNL